MDNLTRIILIAVTIVAPIVTLIVTCRVQKKRNERKTKAAIETVLHYENNADGYIDYVVGRLKAHGYTIDSYAKNDGADFIVRSKSGKTASVKCIFSDTAVQSAAIIAAVDAKNEYECDAAMIVTNGSLTGRARAAAADAKVIVKENYIIPQELRSTGLTWQQTEDPITKTSDATEKMARDIRMIRIIIGIVVLGAFVAAYLFYKYPPQWELTWEVRYK